MKNLKYSNNKEEVLEVDIHKMKHWEAKYYLERLIVSVGQDIKEIIVIHGYHSGTSLLNLVRKELKSKRIKSRYLSLNQGITTLILN